MNQITGMSHSIFTNFQHIATHLDASLSIVEHHVYGDKLPNVGFIFSVDILGALHRVQPNRLYP
jgi:kynurenine formamidase